MELAVFGFLSRHALRRILATTASLGMCAPGVRRSQVPLSLLPISAMPVDPFRSKSRLSDGKARDETTTSEVS